MLLSGDWHTAWVNDLRAVPEDERSEVVATELVTTAVSSEPGFTDARSAPALAANPDVRFYDARTGYTACHVARDHWRADFVTVDATDPADRPSVASRWVIEAGRPRAEPG